jgi:hypothetical protein
MKFIFALPLLLAFATTSQAGCLSNLSSNASSNISRLRQIYNLKQLTKEEYNMLVRSQSALVKMGALTCEGTGAVDFSQGQIDQLVSSVLKLQDTKN